MENYLKILPVAHSDLQRGERYLIQVGFNHWITALWNGREFINLDDGKINVVHLPAYTLPIQ
jgi:hypothetical protein